MKITQKTALILSLLLVLGSAWGKARITLSSMQKKLDVLYTEGIDHDGLSIASEIQEKQKTTRNCITVARRYDSKLDVSLIDAAQAAADSLDQASSMKEQQRKEKKLDSAFLALAGALAEAPLSAKDTEYVIGFVAEYQASQDRIERDPYHAYAASVQKETSGWFPSLLQKLTASPIDIYQIGG